MTEMPPPLSGFATARTAYTQPICQINYSKGREMSEEIDHGQLAVEFLDRAKEQPDNPASTLALVGIGNALLEIAEHLCDLRELDTIGNILFEISKKSLVPPH